MSAVRCPHKTIMLFMTLLLAVVMAPAAHAQSTGTVAGSVVAAGTMEPLPGVQVSIPGTGLGTLTNSAGEFIIPAVPAGQHSVRAQMIGYTPGEQQVSVTEGQTAVLDFSLERGAIQLDEVVVTGAGVTTQKRSLGQSVATVNAEAFEEAPVTNVVQALSGRVPGLVANAAGETGQGAPIRLRGTVSLSQRNGPLVYVDGVRVDNGLDSPVGGAIATNRLNDINPNNIARVEILKGAAAATLFGTEASAGVIQIFTKRGLAGPPQWEFSTTQQMLDMPDRIPANVVWDEDANAFASNSPADDFVRNGHHQQYFLSVRGGQEDARYFASGWWKGETGVFPSNELSNLGVNIALDVVPMERMTSQINLQVIQNELQVPYPTWGLIGEFTLADPTRASEDRPYGELFHSVAGALGYDNLESTNRYTMSGSGRYSWMDGLSSHATIGYNAIQQQRVIFVEYGVDPRNLRGYRNVGDINRENITLDFSTAWEQEFAGRFSSSLTVGAQSFWENSSSNSAAVEDYPSAGLETLRGGVVTDVGENYTEVINAGIFAQEQFGINNRLFLTAGVRVDGNSAFGEDFGFQAYPKAGASWTISEEPFWNIGFFDQLRLRAAYGTSGLQPGAYDALRTWRAYPRLSNTPVLLPYAVGNEDLRPERSTEIELGTDMSFLDNRFGIEATYFSQRTDDAILNRPLAPSLGFLQAQIINIGELQSRGLEVAASLVALEAENARFEVGGTLAFIDQEVTDLGGVSPIRTSNDTRRWNYIREGYQPGAVIAPVLDTNDPYRTTVPIGEVNSLRQIVANTLKNAAGGDSLVFVGNQAPTSTGTIFTSLDIPSANLSFRTLFRGESGYVMLDQTGLIRTQIGITRETAEMVQELSDPTTSAERRAEIAAAYARISPQVHSNWVSDAQNIRFQEASLTWRAPEGLIPGGLSNTSITLAGRNLFLWTPYGGIGDPGASSTPTQDFNQNIDYFSAPTPRRYEITIRTGF